MDTRWLDRDEPLLRFASPYPLLRWRRSASSNIVPKVTTMDKNNDTNTCRCRWGCVGRKFSRSCRHFVSLRQRGSPIPPSLLTFWAKTRFILFSYKIFHWWHRNRGVLQKENLCLVQYISVLCSLLDGSQYISVNVYVYSRAKKILPASRTHRKPRRPSLFSSLTLVKYACLQNRQT